MSAQVPLIAFYEVDDPCEMKDPATVKSSVAGRDSVYLKDIAPTHYQPYIITW